MSVSLFQSTYLSPFHPHPHTLTPSHPPCAPCDLPGEGRFGKVYECHNLDTDEMMAIKQMSVQEKDTGTLQTICDEIGIFQVSHKNIVQFHGLEVHHVSDSCVILSAGVCMCIYNCMR